MASEPPIKGTILFQTPPWSQRDERPKRSRGSRIWIGEPAGRKTGLETSRSRYRGRRRVAKASGRRRWCQGWGLVAGIPLIPRRINWDPKGEAGAQPMCENYTGVY